MTNATENLLHHVYLFKDLDPKELEKLNEVATVETYHAGDEIFSEGDPATALFIVKYGSVKIRHSGKNDAINVASFGGGSHFGEMSFVDNEKRSATVEAIERADLVKIDFNALRALLEKDLAMSVKVYRSLAAFLCGRLRLTTNDLSFAREKNSKLQN